MVRSVKTSHTLKENQASYTNLTRASLVAHLVRMQETPVQCLGREDPLEMGYPVQCLGREGPLEMGQATHSSILGLSWWLRQQRICLQCRRPGFDPWVGNIPWRRERLPTSVFCAGELHKLSPHCCKESDTTERIILACSSLYGVSCDFSFFISGFINMSSLLFS